MEAVNETSKLIAQTLTLLLDFDNGYPNHDEIQQSIVKLESALEIITKSMS